MSDPTAALRQALAVAHATPSGAHRLFAPSLGSEGSCAIGGHLCTNAGGTQVLRCGKVPGQPFPLSEPQGQTP